MAGDKYLKYGRPIPPADPKQDYMTVQETAHVLQCSVTWLRRFLTDHPEYYSRQGRRIVTDRKDRTDIYEARRAGERQTRRPARSRSRRNHKPAAIAADVA